MLINPLISVLALNKNSLWLAVSLRSVLSSYFLQNCLFINNNSVSVSVRNLPEFLFIFSNRAVEFGNPSSEFRRKGCVIWKPQFRVPAERPWNLETPVPSSGRKAVEFGNPSSEFRRKNVHRKNVVIFPAETHFYLICGVAWMKHLLCLSNLTLNWWTMHGLLTAECREVWILNN